MPVGHTPRAMSTPKVNQDAAYSHYLHLVDHTNVTCVVKGDMMVTFLGLVDKGGIHLCNGTYSYIPSDFRPKSLFPVQYNLTYGCPHGQVRVAEKSIRMKKHNKMQVFDSDWFATPLLLLTCKVSVFLCAPLTIYIVLFILIKINIRNLEPLMKWTGMSSAASGVSGQTARDEYSV
jgi:hypothetical protein